MSEETPETPVTETEPTEPTTPEVDENGIPVVITDDFGKMAYAKAKAEGEAYISLQSQIDVAGGNPSAMKEALRETWGTDADSEVTDADRKARAKMEELADAILKIEAARDARLDERIKVIGENAATVIEPLKAQAAKHLDTYRGAVKLLTGMFTDEAAYGLPSVKGTRKASSGSAGGSTGPRIRGVDFYVNGELATNSDKDGNQKSNAAAAAKAANVATSVVQEAFWAAQGTQDSKAFKDSVEFDVTDSNGTTYKIRTTLQPKGE